jgi:hypothetical protein
MSARQDERGFEKADLQIMDPRKVNFQDTGKPALRNIPVNQKLSFLELDGKFGRHFGKIRMKSNLVISPPVNLVERNTCPGGLQLVNPARSGKKDQFDLVEIATAIQSADQFTRATAGSKLSVIAEQVRFLQDQARRVLEEAQRDQEINHMACNFKRIPGKMYYIYKRPNTGKNYMSMISPEVLTTTKSYKAG